MEGAANLGIKMATKHEIQFITEDGERFSFDCAENEDVISAGFRNNVILLSECRKGICTSCRALCTAGDFELGEGVNVYSLPQEDQENGYTLLCQTFPVTGLEIQLPYTSERVTFGSADFDKTMPAEAVSVKRWTDHVVSLELRLSGEASKFSFQPGQYVNLKVPGSEQWRSFSMANCAGWPASNNSGNGRIELMVRLLEDGMFSRYLRESARAGDTIEVRGPFGNFVVHQSQGRPRYFVAGSTGLAPLVAMLRDLALKNDATPARLIFGMRSKNYLFYEEQLKEIGKKMPALTLDLTLETGHEGWAGRIGNVGDALKAALQETGDEPDVYVCGPAPMVESVEHVCRERGIPPARIFTEKFQASG